MLKARGFSLSTKFILFAVVLEVILMVGGLYTSYSYLSRQKLEAAEQILFAQSESLAHQWITGKGQTPVTIGGAQNQESVQVSGSRSDLYSFQLLDATGVVLLDSHSKHRAQKSVLGNHSLFEAAKQSKADRGSLLYFSGQSREKYFGVYLRMSEELYALGAISKKQLDLEVFLFLEKFFQLGVLFSGVSFLLIVAFSVRMIRPIRQLTHAARELSQGNFAVEIESHSQDEIGTLAKTFSLMSMRVQELLREEIQKVRMEKEVDSVADLQKSLLPEDSIHTPRFWIEGHYQAATETGGDYWGYFETPRYLAMYVADATGHGLQSAMLTAAASGAFSAMHRFAIENPQLNLYPSQLLRLANEAVVDTAHLELNMTMFVAVFDFDHQKLYYANAGHYPAWILKSPSAGQPPQIEVLLGSGPRLGEEAEFQSPEDQVTEWGDQDVLFLYSDGLLDCTDADGSPLGKSRLKEALIAAGTDRLDPENLKGAVTQLTENHTGGKPLLDDITFALFKRKTPS